MTHSTERLPVRRLSAAPKLGTSSMREYKWPLTAAAYAMTSVAHPTQQKSERHVITVANNGTIERCTVSAP
eukprot:CAMPEP_0119383522 /NCGR_PEP_ID=MMETSP1334-20130426/80178_1 /TAXON_ID=127549 /ORGANISM="Calcidiscus leptoporus, Strain RCC1130" /LENGTH=70 /DNA_ID=CAMNT_0007404351 /DNA_START=144 /DNA_END=352 /DNA_ORIENTATION=-